MTIKPINFITRSSRISMTFKKFKTLMASQAQREMRYKNMIMLKKVGGDDLFIKANKVTLVNNFSIKREALSHRHFKQINKTNLLQRRLCLRMILSLSILVTKRNLNKIPRSL